MDRLCNEVLQLIFFELDDPTPLILCAKRFLDFSRDPWIRASYFLHRYGPIHAMFHAMGRGAIATPEVIDILLSSGAQLSRYLVQTGIHHYYRNNVSFIKSKWVKSMPFKHWTYLESVAASRFDKIPTGKGEDDGNIVHTFLKESRFPSDLRSVNTDEIREILQKYKFMPFSYKDSLMSQFPLLLSVEPSLLPLATANGFQLSPKYRDFVFRKMFEKRLDLPESSVSHVEDIAQHVRDLVKLDSSMFITRTVAAEVCMESPTNEHAYNALKALDKAGELKFELSSLVEDLLKLFVSTRSITSQTTHNVIRTLYADFPSTDSTVRLVLMLTVFLSDPYIMHTTPTTLKNKLEALGLLPVTRRDIIGVLCNPFVEKYAPILGLARTCLNLNSKEVKELVEEVAIKCLEIGSKGKMLKRLRDQHSWLKDSIELVVVQRYQINVEDLPEPEDEEACRMFEAKLCRDYIVPRFGRDGNAYGPLDDDYVGAGGDVQVQEEVAAEMIAEMEREEHEEEPVDQQELGSISQDTLTAMIRADESSPGRSRRRRYFWDYNYGDVQSKLRYPMDSVQVGKWIPQEYDWKSPVVAVFMTHAVINGNPAIIQHYLGHNAYHETGHVPITLKHFKMLARLGRAPSSALWHQIQRGAEFFFAEEDYVRKEDGARKKDKGKRRMSIKTEAQNQDISAALAGASPGRGRKRPRRSAAAGVKSYAVPESDEDDSMGEWEEDSKAKKKKTAESNLQKWIKHLTVLQKEEQKKYKEKKKRVEKTAEPGTKTRLPKSDFLRVLTSNLRDLRKEDQAKRRALYGSDVEDQDYSDGDDDEYKDRSKRRKSAP